jgi:hypothetical protein
MPSKSTARCVDPVIGRTLATFLDGTLDNKSAGKRIRKHLKECDVCRRCAIAHAHRTVTVPILHRIAREKGVTVKTVLSELRRVAEKTDQK